MQNYVSTAEILSFIQDCPCNNTIYVTVITSTVLQVFHYISFSTSSYEAASIRTSLYFKRVNLNMITDKMKSDMNSNSASTSRHDTEDNSDHIKYALTLSLELLGFR